MPLPRLPLVVLDTETTGFVPRTHRVIEYAAARVEGGKIVEEYEQLFACEEIPPHVEVLTRIRTADLQGKPAFEEKRDAILAAIPEGSLIVGQNVLFDIGMLKGEGIDLSARPWIDTSMLASLVFPELRSYSLGYLSRVLNLKHDPPHRALGDVRATLSLLEQCWGRLLELPPAMRDAAVSVMERSSPGYRLLFSALPPSTAVSAPAWLKDRPRDDVPDSSAVLPIPAPAGNGVELREEPLDPAHLQAILRGAEADTSASHWVAVKNIRVALRRLPPDLKASVEADRIRALYAPSGILDPAAVERLMAQEAFTPDEATIACKIAWHGRLRRDEMPLHGGEEAVWNGKLASTDASPGYAAQFSGVPGVTILDHRELLRFLDAPDHPARRALSGPVHVVVDDASMLEDTATKAFGWTCGMDDLRAAAQGDDLLTRLVDLVQLWIEKTRQTQDLRYVTDSDVRTPEAAGLREQMDAVLAAQAWPDRTREALQCVRKVLDPENLGGRITWIEQRQNGSQTIQSVPERIGTRLSETLYGAYPTTLLIPFGCAEMMPEILPPDREPARAMLPENAPFENALPVSLKPHPSLDLILAEPPPGKTIVLLPGKSSIEDLYVKHTERLEQKGVTLICQGIGGGQGRMQAEFLAAPTPAVWLLTPWMFEGLELPPGTVDHLLIKTLPFDHPANPVLSRRSARYRDGFREYAMARLLHRLFRILRTYARFKKPGADVRFMDDRIFSKSYGKSVQQYLARLSLGPPVEPSAGDPPTPAFTSTKVGTPPRQKKPKAPQGPVDDKQLPLF